VRDNEWLFRWWAHDTDDDSDFARWSPYENEPVRFSASPMTSEQQGDPEYTMFRFAVRAGAPFHFKDLGKEDAHAQHQRTPEVT